MKNRSTKNRPAGHSGVCAASGGFTLVEVVVALGVLSLILLATVSALRTFANTQVSLDKIVARVDEVRTLSSFLRDTLGGAVTGSNEGGGMSFGGGASELAHFAGDEKSLSWKTTALFGEAYGGTVLMRIAKEDDTLMLYWQDPLPPGIPVVWENKNSRILLESVEEFEVSFRPEFDLDWQSGEWDTPGAPALVRLTIKAGGRYWPDLIIGVQR